MPYKEKAKAIEYNNKWISRAYDRINLTVPKDKKQELQVIADLEGKSLNAWINEAIQDKLTKSLRT